MGASLAIHHYSPHDAEQPWGTDDIGEVVAALRGDVTGGANVHDMSLDLSDAEAADTLISDASSALGHLDILVCNHAQSGHAGPLSETTADDLDRHWQVNTRSTVLATRAFADQHDGREGGRVVWMTSGQQLGPMTGNVAYAASKAALAGLTATVADELIERGIVLNTVNPGPVNTGYLDEHMVGEAGREILERFPSNRFGEPGDPARLIAWLVSDEGRSVVGQVLDTEGGFRRW